ncbi:MAG: hypothetical protein S0880_13140 [Actinomycetota bacterium]|nr:hypothetical protein [Actinomycetota bacterium]
MPRTSVTPTDLNANAGTDIDATTIDSTLVTNGVAIADAGASDRIVMRVTNTHGSPHDVTIVAGDYPPAIGAGLGDVAVTVAATSGDTWIGPLESGRFLQSDGTIHVDLDTGHVGALDVIKLPRAV